MKHLDENIRDALVLLSIMIIVLGIVIWAAKVDESGIDYNKKEVDVDSICDVTDSLKTNVNYLESIKNYEVQKVFAFDNDTTVKLFEQLVKE